MTRSSHVAFGVLLVLAATGCAGRSLTAPNAVPAASLSGAIPPNVALFDLHLDRGSLNAQLMPVHSVAAQPPQNQSYDLDIAKFLTRQTLQVEAVRLNDFEDVVVRLRHSHPFPAPDFTAPITGKNRADLGYTGRLMILADETSQSLNSGSITVDPWTVRDVDGYMPAGDLLRDSAGLTNTYFPFILLVDEAKNNRPGISNGAVATGNYDAASGGWQRANAGSNGTAWTGFDYLHGGQSCLNEFTLRGDTFAASSWDVRLAVVIQYTDPRGMGGLDLRFPPETVDVAQFAYRLPYAALDVSRVSGNWDLYMHPDAAAVTKLDFRVRDWDARATPSTDNDLSDEPDVAKVQPNGGGLPTVQLVMPDLLISPLLLASTSGTGIAGNEFRYLGDLSNPLAAAPGEYWGSLEAVDPEFGDPDREDYHFGVDPITLAPTATRALNPITVLPVRVTVAPDTTSWGRSWGDRFDEEATGIAVDSDGNTYVAGGIYAHGTDQEPGDSRLAPTPAGFGDACLTKFDQYGNRIWTGFLGQAGSFSQVGELACTPAGDLIVWLFTDAEDLDVDPGPGVAPVGDGGITPDALLCYGPDGALKWSSYMPIDIAQSAPYGNIFFNMTVGVDGSVYNCGIFNGTRDFDPGPGVTEVTAVAPGTATDGYLQRLDANGDFDWVRTWGTPNDVFGCVTHDAAACPNGNVAFTGSMTLADADDGGTVDVDPTAGVDSYRGNRRGSAMVGVLSPTGAYVWGRAWGTSDPAPGTPDLFGDGFNVASDAQNRLYLFGQYSGDGDFDPGPGVVPFDSGSIFFRPYLASYSATGDFRWAFDYNTPNNDTAIYPQNLWVAENGHLYCGGYFTQTLDFDPAAATQSRTPSNGIAGLLMSYTSGGAYRFAKSLTNSEIARPYAALYPIPGGGIAGAGITVDGGDVDFGAATQVLPAHGANDGFFTHLSEEGEWE